MKKNRNCESGWWVVLLTATLAAPVVGEASAGLFNAKLKQVITSSTLKWNNLKKEAMDTYVIGAESPQGPIYLCRAQHEGDMLLGQLRPEYTSCAISGSKSYNVFEVLQNIENASLITWNPWVKFSPKPSGGILVDSSVDSIFIGRMKAESGFPHNIGRIAYDFATGILLTFDDKNNEITETQGDILVEVEPVSYKLEDVELDLTTEQVRSSDPEIFGERVLQNDENTAATFTAAIEYKFNYSVSWGHGHGIGIGLNTSIEMADGTIYPQIEWAIPFTQERSQFYNLERYLEPGTACNVTFRGNRTERDVQYTGRLTTYYNDHDPRSRQMRGERTEITMEVEAVYGEIYFLGNNSLVPTTTTTTTSTTTTTTTIAAPTISTESDKNNIPIAIAENPKQPGEIDSNNLVDSNMDKVPQSKEPNINNAIVGPLGSNPNGANIRIISLTLFIPVFALLL